MGRIAWYKRSARDFLEGTRGLTLEEKGAYACVLELIYDRENRLPDDDRFIAGNIGCEVRVWRRVKERLIGLGKLYLADGFVRNRRADIEVDSALRSWNQKRMAGERSAEERAKSRPETNGSSGLVGTDVETVASADPPQTKTKTKKEEKDERGAAAPGSRYAFQGEVIRLNRRDLQALKEACPSIPVDAELLAYDAILAVKATPEERKNAFWSVKARMAKLERQASERLAVERERIASCGTPVRDWRLDPSNPYDSLPG